MASHRCKLDTIAIVAEETTEHSKARDIKEDELGIA